MTHNLLNSKISSLSNPPRINYVDSAKGLCVILVVVLHTLSVEDLFNNLLFMLRMPLFFFCSGLFCAGAMALNWPRFLTTKVAPILWLYLVWSVIVYFSTFAIWAVVQEEQVDLTRPLTIFWQPAQTLWFLYALAITYALTRAMIRIPVIVVILISVIAYSFSMYQADLMNASFLHKLARFFPFFYLAFVMKDIVPVYVNTCRKYWPLWLTAFFGISYVVFDSLYLGVGPLGLTLGLLGIFSVLCLLSEFESSRWVRLLAWIGKRSIFVLVIHRIPLFYASEWIKNSDYYGDIAIELFVAAGVVCASLFVGEILSRSVNKYFFVAPWIDDVPAACRIGSERNAYLAREKRKT
jgi:fucose 4-O-acetylase-like acetyltransferase